MTGGYFFPFGSFLWFMKAPTKKQREAARMASPHHEDRFTDKEENEMYRQGYLAMRRKLAGDSNPAPELRARCAPGRED